MKASIIITSYNYDPFLPEAIDSALRQTHPDTEVIAVDDGSTDRSREIIRGYGDRVRAIFRENAGQAASFNAGFTASTGEIILFLDSDDVLLPTALEKAAALFASDLSLSKVHWPVRIIDREGRDQGRVFPSAQPSEGDLRERVLREGPAHYLWPPTSGNVWARSFLETVLPIPEAEYKTCPDFYLSAFAPVFGPMRTVAEPQSRWRLHGGNNSTRRRFDDWLRVELDRWQHCADQLASYCERRGLPADQKLWERNSWMPRIEAATREIRRWVPEGEAMIFVDEDSWGAGEEISGRRRIPFLEKDGEYWGAPLDNRTAIAELERLRKAGAGYLVIAWNAFWWLDHFLEFASHLESSFRRVFADEQVIIFDLHPRP